eukprot:GHVP01006892.1.p1 GENE.GHVP01006892.1~~GHVP01006892.1.p1  ORF type:complete len:119 (-),score=14.63 GHVP01006892.1:401-730(-)
MPKQLVVFFPEDIQPTKLEDILKDAKSGQRKQPVESTYPKWTEYKVTATDDCEFDIFVCQAKEGNPSIIFKRDSTHKNVFYKISRGRQKKIDLIQNLEQLVKKSSGTHG